MTKKTIKKEPKKLEISLFLKSHRVYEAIKEDIEALKHEVPAFGNLYNHWLTVDQYEKILKTFGLKNTSKVECLLELDVSDKTKNHLGANNISNGEIELAVQGITKWYTKNYIEVDQDI